MGGWIIYFKKNILFAILVFVFFFLKSIENLFVFTPIFRAYCYDLFAVPIIAHIALKFQQQFTYKNSNYRFKFIHILFITAYLSIVFELILPKYDSSYTKDYIDIIAYGIGALFFWKFMNK